MRAVVVLVVISALVSAVFSQVNCTAQTTCSACNANANYCGFCVVGTSGSCHAWTTDAGVENATTFCTHMQGTFSNTCDTPVASAVAPATTTGPTCPADATCVNCHAVDGCGFCRYSTGTICGPNTATSTSASISSVCETHQGTIATTCDTAVAPAVHVPPPSPQYCSSRMCGECLADARCGYCRSNSTSSTVWAVCRALESSTESFAAFCLREGGHTVAAGTCDHETAVVPAPPAPVSDSTTDTICVPRSTCAGCFERTECGQCSMSTGAVCRGKELTVNGETGPTYCHRVGGAWAASRVTDAVADVCQVSDVVQKLNSGDVTPGDVNNDLASTPPVNGFIVIVTVITEAGHNADGSAHFQTFVDVSGDTAPNADQKRGICDGIANSLSTHLSIERSKIKCELTQTAKRATSSYVADLTVGQQTAGAASVVASVALIATALLAAF